MILRPTSLSSLTSLRGASPLHLSFLDHGCCTRTSKWSLPHPSTTTSTLNENLRVQCPNTRGQQTRAFSQSCGPLLSSAAHPPDHYAILRIPPDATPSDLKKQFYVLSKETHPDRNRQDPKAAERFAQISESYSVLANPEKRRRYDRDVYHVHHGHHRAHSRAHGHHSSHAAHKSYAGSRPPTGLSKRRSAFKGPPPSFYAHGKPCANTTSQAQAHASAAAQEQAQAGTFNSAAFTDGGGFAFDPQSTFKTQTHEDYRRANRRAAEVEAARAAAAEENDFWSRFIIVAGVITLSVSVGTIVVSMANTPKGGLTRADGSRRDGPRNDWTKA